MAPAGVISSVLGMGGRAAAARVAAAVPGVRGCTVTVGSTPPPSAAFVPAVLPGVRGRTVSARSTPPPSAAIVPAAVSGVRVRTVSARSTPPHSAAAFPATARRLVVSSADARQPATRYMSSTLFGTTIASHAVQSKGLVVSKAGTGTAEKAPVEDQPPPGGFKWRFAQVIKKISEEIRRSGFNMILLLISVLVAYIALKPKHTYKSRAQYAIDICERGEKIFKFASHFVPIALALWKCFRG